MANHLYNLKSYQYSTECGLASSAATVMSQAATTTGAAKGNQQYNAKKGEGMIAVSSEAMVSLQY